VTISGDRAQTTRPDRAVRRVCQVTRLRPEKREEYLRLHAAVWPAVEQRIREAGLENYTIFLRDDLLIGYYEYRGEDLAAAHASIAEDPETQRWWALTDPCQADPEPEQPGGPWRDAVEVWHLPPGP
jgi:L-rhamnose mutarotase